MKFGQDAVTGTALLGQRTTRSLIDHKFSKVKNTFANNNRCMNSSLDCHWIVTSELCIITHIMFPVMTRAAKEV